ncbi:Uncharacterised protein [Corynebacterium renale]|nr:Uncharacterised protein [Corynebacterium renale]SQI18900.1 Uncharacterised protein [Corynebacterium renale]STC97267.1 Uncharacterised protein [Corynebacterium renale]
MKKLLEKFLQELFVYEERGVKTSGYDALLRDARDGSCQTSGHP